VAVLVGLILAGVGIYGLIKGTGGLALLGTGVTLIVLSLLIHIMVTILLKAEDNINRLHLDAVNLLDNLRRLSPLLKTISDNSQISDNARSLAHRELEREALRQAIREEMYRGDWEAAHYLIDQMEHRFGYKQEAKSLLEELNKVRVMTIEDKINEAVTHIESLMNERKWERARQESERLMKLFPRHERITALPTELSRRRETRKQELLAKWKVAVERDDVDNSIVILTELDQYLSRSEAQSLQDSVRHVFKIRLVNLGVQFGLAATEGRWRDALESGLLIRREFPNSRMAREVAAKMDVLRVRAGFLPETEANQKQPEQTNQTA
jgi:hypothetical protein